MGPQIIQGGMGVGVSDWRLARAVAGQGQLGVVSGTALDQMLVRRLADGDPGGHCRRALDAFPMPETATDIVARFFNPGGRPPGAAYPNLSFPARVLGEFRSSLVVAANFVEVFLAKEGHDGVVGINLLEKIQIPTLASLYGAMLAGVDYVLMGAGIPREIPGALDRLARHEPARISLHVQGGSGEDDEVLDFDPGGLREAPATPLRRPDFLPIVASNSLATMMVRKATGRVDGFVVEGPTAGGHNAPPRGPRQYNPRGEPVYGDRDVVDLGRIADLSLPFWVAGGAGRPERLREVQAVGATGIQVGTLFAYCDESGIEEGLKREVVARSADGCVDIFTDDRASPTGFPFKVALVEDTLSEAAVYETRERICDLGYLRVAYRCDDGRIGYRCAAEPVGTFMKKGGSRDDAIGRKCLCNALMASIGLGQTRGDGRKEPSLLTSGDDLRVLRTFLNGRDRYSAGDVVDYLLEAEGGDA